MEKKKKEKKYGENEYKIPRIIVGCCLVGLMVCYGICVIVGLDVFSIFPALIALFSGVLLIVFCVIIWQQKKKVELGYDDMVVCKLCGVAGVLIILFGILCLIVSTKG